MKIKTVKIENFRSFKNETIDFDNYNCFVGPNGAGKSTVLNALNVFFRYCMVGEARAIGSLEKVVSRSFY